MRPTCIGMKNPKEIFDAPLYNPEKTARGDVGTFSHRDKISRPKYFVNQPNRFLDRFSYTKKLVERTPVGVGPGTYRPEKKSRLGTQKPRPRLVNDENRDGYEMVGESKVFNKSMCSLSKQKLLNKFRINIDLSSTVNVGGNTSRYGPQSTTSRDSIQHPMLSERGALTARARGGNPILFTVPSVPSLVKVRSSAVLDTQAQNGNNQSLAETMNTVEKISTPEKIKILQTLLHKTDEEITEILENKERRAVNEKPHMEYSYSHRVLTGSLSHRFLNTTEGRLSVTKQSLSPSSGGGCINHLRDVYGKKTTEQQIVTSIQTEVENYIDRQYTNM